MANRPGDAAPLPVELEAQDELGTIKSVHLIQPYEETFYREMIQPISAGKKVPWDRFLPLVPGGTSKYRDPVAGYRDTMPTEEEVERPAAEYYG